LILVRNICFISYAIVLCDSLESLSSSSNLTRGEMKSRRLGQPGAEERKHEKRQRGEGEQPAPAERRHEHNGERDLEARSNRPEQIGEDDTSGALRLRQELGVKRHRLWRSSDTKTHQSAQDQQPDEHWRQCRHRSEVERKQCAQNQALYNKNYYYPYY
jgi:hypothetical protein